MLQTVELYFLIFISYSVIGWFMEIIKLSIQYKRFINRGFLIGPYLPIYGFGALFITLFLKKYSNDVVALFVLSTTICSILEYFTSYLMEKIFCARWWDYSNYKFNLNGRICLKNMILFGISGVVMMKFINPSIYKFYLSFDKTILNIICLVILLIFITDLIISTIILISVRKENRLCIGDSTEKMSKIVYDKIKTLGWGYRRLLKAFPDVYSIGKIIDDSKNMAVNYINEKRQKYINKEKDLLKKLKEQQEKIQDKYSKKITKVRDKSDKVISKIEKRNQKK